MKFEKFTVESRVNGRQLFVPLNFPMLSMGMLSEVGRYLRLNLVGHRPLASTVNLEPGSEVIISLSTTPERIQKIGPAIASMLDQTVLPKRILLYLPRKSHRGIPYEVPSFLHDHPFVEIKWVENDLGPATKWFYLLNDASIPVGTPLIILDDDQVYPRQMVEHYLGGLQQIPGAAFTLLGWKTPASLKHADRRCLASAGLRLLGDAGRVSIVNEPQLVHCVQGASSYMVVKGSVQPSEQYFLDHEAAGYADDILISGLLAEQGVPVYVLPAAFKFIRLHVLKMMRAPSLYKNTNQSADYNDQLYRLFAGHWNINK